MSCARHFWLPVLLSVALAVAATPVAGQGPVLFEEAYLAGEPGGPGLSGDEVSTSIALAGDTVILGGPGDSSEPSGLAYVFVRQGDDWIQTQKLVGSGGGEGDRFGGTAAIDGDTAVIGAIYADTQGSNSGAVYVFVRQGGEWSEQQKLVAADGEASDFFGQAVAVAGDTLVVGASGDDDGGDRAGASYVFTRSGGTWTEQQKLTASDAAADSIFGVRVAMTADTLLIGASRADGAFKDSGAVYVFGLEAGVWTERQKLEPSDPEDFGVFGSDVALDGDVAVVGGRVTGAEAYVFEREAGSWIETQQLPGPPGNLTYFTDAAAVEGDVIVVTASQESPGGAAYVFERIGPIWVQTQRLALDDSTTQLGRAAAIDGDTLFLGDLYDSEEGPGAGAGHVFERVAGEWQHARKLVPDVINPWVDFGRAVALAPDLAVVGAPDDDELANDAGAAYVFERDLSGWHPVEKLFGSGTGLNHSFGLEVATDGDTVLVASDRYSTTPLNEGGAWVFARGEGGWVEQQALVATDLAVSRLGRSAAIEGDVAVLGAALASAGAALVFERSGEVWSEIQTLVPSDGITGDLFAASAAIDGDTLVVGAKRHDSAAVNAGAAYVFVRDGGIWIEQQKLTAFEAEAGEELGYAVDISGDTIVAGAIFADGGGSARGAIYVFVRDGTTWTEQQMLIASDGRNNDTLGKAVAIAGDTVLAGSDAFDDGGAVWPGAAYVFRREEGVWTERQKLVSRQPGTAARFGDALSASPDGRFLIGARTEYSAETRWGTAYVVGGSGIFADGFESGDVSAWSSAVP